MRVLHVDTGLEMRGGQYQVLLLLKALRAAGHECELLSPQKGRLWAAASLAGVAVHPATKRSLWTVSPRFELVHAHDAAGHTMCAVASRRPFLVSRRVAFPVQKSALSRWKYRQASRYLAVSRFVARELANSGISADMIDVVYDAVDAPRGSSRWSDEAPAVALSSNDPEKGRDLVEAAAGQSGVRINFANDIVVALREASMFVYVTRSEGLGSAALLAMQMGVPVIASEIGGLAEVFEDGVSGLYVRNDPGEIARAMRRMLSSRTFAQTIIQNGYARIDALFTPERLLAGTLAAYEKVLAA